MELMNAVAVVSCSQMWWCGVLAQELPLLEGNRLREEAQ